MSRPRREPLAAVTLQRSGGPQSGRVFLPVDMVSPETNHALKADFERTFLDEDDVARLALLERAVASPTVTVETYPGYETPQELHAYVRAPAVSPAPIFACVLGSLDLVEHLVKQPPHSVMETASFQAVESELTDASIIAAIESWIGRLWPSVPLPKVLLSPWPGAVESGDYWRTLLEVLATDAALEGGTGEVIYFPPGDLVPEQFRSPERAA
jgi:hypothetical protein